MKSSWEELRRWLNYAWQLEDFHRVLRKLERPKPMARGPEEPGWRRVLEAGRWRVELRPAAGEARMLDTDTWTVIRCSQKEMETLLSLFLREQKGETGVKKGKLALVLAGGGAKGAYQIGVWRALRELGLEGAVEGIAGTSIGAVNAMLFARGDYGYARELWLRFCDPRFRMERRRRVEAFKRCDNPACIPILRELANDRFLVQPALENALLQAAEGYEARLRKNYHIFSAMVRKKDAEPSQVLVPRPENAVYVPWGVLRRRDMALAALASAAVPVLYNPVNFRGTEYYDGGLADNLPFRPLYDCGYRRFILVHLKQRSGARGLPGIREPEDREACRAVHIIPGKGFRDDLSAMLLLTREAVEERMERGYREAMEQRGALEKLMA